MNFAGTTYNTGAATYTAEADTSDPRMDITSGAATTFTATANNVEFATGLVSLENGSDLTVNVTTGDITVYGIRGTSYEDVTLDSTTGTVTVGAGGIGSGTGIEDVSIDADGAGGLIVLKLSLIHI